MKYISWNVNGIRASHKKGAFSELIKLDADVIGVQETKSTPDQLPQEVLTPPGYFAYFDSAKVRKGYSGVAAYSKVEPSKVLYGLGDEEYDTEGRCITLCFEDTAFVTAYFPNGGRDEEHFQFKLRYYEKFLEHVGQLEEEYSQVIFCGDLNVAHNEIDLTRAKENANHIGFLPVERAWVDRVQEAGFVDTFRALHPEKIKYSWWDQKTNSRERNIGWRIDYFFVNADMFESVIKADILDDMLGSDHAPVILITK